MDFNNENEIINGMFEYFKTHDIYDNNLMKCTSYKYGKKNDPMIERLISLDKYGEYLGRYWYSMSHSPEFERDNNITFYMHDDKIAGLWSNIGGFIDTYEIFDYYDGYYVGARYMAMNRTVSNLFFSYYIINDGKVSEIIDLLNPHDNAKVSMERIKLRYDGDETILENSTIFFYKKNGKNYEITKQLDEKDLLKDEDFERVIDNQKVLCKQLKKKLKSCKTLEDIVNAFFDVIGTAEENPEETVGYSAGTFPYSFDDNPLCLFTLMRTTPDEEDEFYQLELTVSFDLDGEKIPYDYIVDNDDDDFRTVVLNSESFNAFKNKKIREITVEVNET